jgi:hypothetical protein
VYLFVEEMRNFLAAMRGLLLPQGLTSDPATSNATLLAEIQRKVALSSSGAAANSSAAMLPGLRQ